MATSRPVRVGIMGFGQIGRQIYALATDSDDIEIVAVADIGDPRILHYLLCSEVEDAARSVLHMANMPPSANVQFMTVMATKMPYIGRG